MKGSVVGMQPTPEDLAVVQAKVETLLFKAEELFKTRNAKYKNAFMLEGAVGNAHMLRHKATRMLRKVMDYARWLEDTSAYELGYGESPPRPDPDDVIDLINYACFLVICLEDGVILETESTSDEAICTCTDDQPCPMHAHAILMADEWMKAHPEFDYGE